MICQFLSTIMSLYFKPNLSTLILALHFSWEKVTISDKEGSILFSSWVSSYHEVSWWESLDSLERKLSFTAGTPNTTDPCRSEPNRMTMMTYSWWYSFSSFNSHCYPCLILWFIHETFGVSSNQRLERIWLFIQSLFLCHTQFWNKRMNAHEWWCQLCWGSRWSLRAVSNLSPL